MSKNIFLFCLSMILFISCGGEKKPTQEDSFTEKSEEIESKSNLSSACEKDLKKFGKYLDEAKAYVQKQADGYEPTEEDEQEWKTKTMNLAREMTSSAGAYSDVDCIMAFQEIQMEFSQVMMEMAQAQM